MRGDSVNTDAELRAWLDVFFESKPRDFYKRDIGNLVECWEEVVNNNYMKIENV